MKGPEDFLTLIVSLQGDLEELVSIQRDNGQALLRRDAGAEHALDLAAWGYTLHGGYNILENYFLRVSKFFENHLPSEAWHRELLERMRLDLAPIRPALIDDSDLYQALQDLRAFRHVFRHQYGQKLRRDKLNLVQQAFDLVVLRFPTAHERFIARLKAVAAGLS